MQQNPRGAVPAPTQTRALAQPGIVETFLRELLAADPRQAVEVARMRALWLTYKQEPGRMSWGETVDPPTYIRMMLFALANQLDMAGGDIVALGNKPYVTFEARLKRAMASGQFDGFSEDRLIPPSEYERHGIVDRSAEEPVSCAWLSVAARRDMKYAFPGIGIAYKNEMGPKGPQPVARKHALYMAQERARRRALQLAFPLAVPGAVPNHLEPNEVVADATVVTQSDHEPMPQTAEEQPAATDTPERATAMARFAAACAANPEQAERVFGSRTPDTSTWDAAMLDMGCEDLKVTR